MGADCVIDSRGDRVCVSDVRGDLLVDGVLDTSADPLELDDIEVDGREETDGGGLRDTPGDRDDEPDCDDCSELLLTKESVAPLEDVNDTRGVIVETSRDGVSAAEEDGDGEIDGDTVCVRDVLADVDSFSVDRPVGIDVKEAETEPDSVHATDTDSTADTEKAATVGDAENDVSGVPDSETRDDGEVRAEAEVHDDNDGDAVEDRLGRTMERVCVNVTAGVDVVLGDGDADLVLDDDAE
jgi:hypothetical protein